MKGIRCLQSDCMKASEGPGVFCAEHTARPACQIHGTDWTPQPWESCPVCKPDTRPATCEWFALCNNPADGFLEHPILGVVPTCYRCANKLDLRLQFGTGPLCEEDPDREEWCAYHRTDHYATTTTEGGAGRD